MTFLLDLSCPFPVRAYITFQCNRGWHYHLLSADLRTALTPWKRAADQDTLLGVIERLHGDMEEVARDVRRWNRAPAHGLIFHRLNADILGYARPNVTPIAPSVCLAAGRTSRRQRVYHRAWVWLA